MKHLMGVVLAWTILCVPAAHADVDAIRATILGEGPASGELDLNEDGVVDVADLVMATQATDISLDDRWAAIELASDYFYSLGSMPVAEKNAAMVAWLLEQPLFKAAGIDTEIVWAYFLDGLPILFADNRRSSPSPTATSNADALEPDNSPSNFKVMGASDQEAPEGAADPHLVWFDADQPDSKRVLFIDVFESGFASNDVTPHIQQRLQDVGYSLGSVSTAAEPTMDAFKAQVSNLGLFYIATHSGSGRFEEDIDSVPVEGSYFAFQSNIELTREKFAALADTDVINKRLVPFIASIAQDANGNSFARAPRWGITERFVQHYFSFAKNSLAFIDGCNSNDPRMSNALTNKGADVLLHWDNSVFDDDAALVEDQLFRRLIGSDQIESVNDTSPVRPFDIDSVWEEMKRFELLQDSSGTKLGLHREEDSDFALLVPSIRSMQVYGADGTLHLYGLFGANPGAGGAVFVGGVSMPFQSWDKWEIIVDLPSTAYGEVYVLKNGISGNKVALSLYTGNGTTELISPTNGNFASANFTISFRGDFSPFRVKPDGPPVYWQSEEFVDYSEDPEFPKFATRYVEYPLGLSHVAFLDGESEIIYNYGGQLDNGNCENIGFIRGGGSLPVILTNPTHDIPVIPEGFRGLASLSLFEIPGVKTWVIEVGAPGANGMYTNSGCDPHDNESIDLLASGLGAVDTRAAFGENGSVEGDIFESGEISPRAYTFDTILTIPTMDPQPPHDPSMYPD